MLVYVLLGAQHGWTPEARRVAAVGALMASWWMTEALPIEATGLLPIALFPLLSIAPLDKAAAPYADKIIFLFLGGMLLGQTMERWNLHTRFSLRVISLLGASPSRLIGAFLLAAALLSMWVSNTAATVMMLPIGASVASWVREQRRAAASPDGHTASDRLDDELGAAIVLAIAFGASIGGVGSIIGTPPIAQFAAYVNRLADQNGGDRVTFFTWLRLGLPTLLIMLPAAWFVLSRMAFRFPREESGDIRPRMRQMLTSLGPMSAPQYLTLAVFAGAAILWVGGHWLEIEDSVIAIGAAILLFIIPVRDGDGPRRSLLTWREAERIPWGVLLLFGGGLSLAQAIKSTGVDALIAAGADGLAGLPLLPLLWIIALVTIILTEFTSNTALVAAGLPVAEAVASRLGVPGAAVLVTMTLTASLGFMLPAGTAPNALIFASGRVSMKQMMRAGFRLDVLAAVLVPLLVLGALRAGFLPGA